MSNFKSLRATLVFLFATSLAACSGTSNMMPTTATGAAQSSIVPGASAPITGAKIVRPFPSQTALPHAGGGKMHSMAWSGCSGGTTDFGCNINQKPDDGSSFYECSSVYGGDVGSPGSKMSTFPVCGYVSYCGTGGPCDPFGNEPTSGGNPLPCQPISSCVAYQGNAAAGKPCDHLNSQSSSPIGDVLDGKPDTPGPSGNEVNQVYYLGLNAGGSSTGAVSSGLGYIATTFNGERWVQIPVSIPIFSGVQAVSMGNGSVYQGALSTGAVVSAINTWISKPKNGANVAVQAVVKQYSASLPTSVRVTACFTPPGWDGKSTG